MQKITIFGNTYIINADLQKTIGKNKSTVLPVSTRLNFRSKPAKLPVKPAEKTEIIRTKKKRIHHNGTKNKQAYKKNNT